MDTEGLDLLPKLNTSRTRNLGDRAVLSRDGLKEIMEKRGKQKAVENVVEERDGGDSVRVAMAEREGGLVAIAASDGEQRRVRGGAEDLGNGGVARQWCAALAQG
ncbi:hypothetical protein HAX54_040628 [Datura stramonium]|uniref:Uncharacterized protein n=1 Tax=Datura stramonium TaxID=4076 RepID=A0ABS8VSS4_DATST|nr:hypothetical protein [Datura stramonium]